MAKGKRPFSSFLESPDAKKAVQDALHAPAQLPTQESPARVEPVKETTPETVQEETIRVKPGPKKKPDDQKEDYQLVLVKRSIHRLLKLASVHYGVEIREIASDAISADPRIQEMQERFGEK